MKNNEKTIETVLANLKNRTDAISAIAATITGLNLADTVNHNDQDNKLAAMLATGLGSGQEAMKFMGQGVVRQCIICTDDATLIIIPAGEKALLTLLLSNHFVHDEESMPQVEIKLAAQEIAKVLTYKRNR